MPLPLYHLAVALCRSAFPTGQQCYLLLWGLGTEAASMGDSPDYARENLPLALMPCVLWVLGVKANESLEASQKNNNRFYYVG